MGSIASSEFVPKQPIRRYLWKLKGHSGYRLQANASAQPQPRLVALIQELSTGTEWQSKLEKPLGTVPVPERATDFADMMVDRHGPPNGKKERKGWPVLYVLSHSTVGHVAGVTTNTALGGVAPIMKSRHAVRSPHTCSSCTTPALRTIKRLSMSLLPLGTCLLGNLNIPCSDPLRMRFSDQLTAPALYN